MGKLTVWSVASFSGGGDEVPGGEPRITTTKTAINPIATPAVAGRYRRNPGPGGGGVAIGSGATGSGTTGSGTTGSGTTGSGTTGSGSGTTGSGTTGSGTTGSGTTGCGTTGSGTTGSGTTGCGTTGSGATGSDSENHLAGALAFRHGRQGTRRLGERKPDRDVRLDVPGVVQVEQSAGRRRNELRSAL